MKTIIILLGLGCAPPLEHIGSVSDGQVAAGDSGLQDTAPRPADCRREDSYFGPREVTVSAVQTVATVTWQTETEALSYLMLGDTGGARTAFAADAVVGTAHSATLVGLQAGQLYQMTAVAEPIDGGQALCSDTTAHEAGHLPASLPDWQTDGSAEPGGVGFRVVPIMDMDSAHVAVLDLNGEVVWAHKVLQAQGGGSPVVYKAEVREDGQGIIYMTQAIGLDKPGVLHSLGWGGERMSPVEIDGAHTDFVQLPDGGFATLGWDVRTVEGGRRLLGDTILEIAPSGEVREVWNIWDHLEPDLSQQYPKGFLLGEPEVEDWSHVNSLSYVDAEGAFYVTVTEPSAVVRVKRHSGAQSWVLSGEGGSFQTTEPDLVEAPHSSQRLGDDILVFNRRDPAVHETCSDATLIRLDMDAMSAESVWRYTGDRCAQVGFLGNAIRVPGGNTVVSWSQLGQLDEVDPDGIPVWQVKLKAGAGFGFVSWADILH